MQIIKRVKNKDKLRNNDYECKTMIKRKKITILINIMAIAQNNNYRDITKTNSNFGSDGTPYLRQLFILLLFQVQIWRLWHHCEDWHELQGRLQQLENIFKMCSMHSMKRLFYEKQYLYLHHRKQEIFNKNLKSYLINPHPRDVASIYLNSKI